MLDFAALDVAIGIILVYFVLAVVCSALNETIAGAMGWRAKYLRVGVANLLEPERLQRGEELAAQLYLHPVINGLIRPLSRRGKRRYPSYLPARAFATALLDFDATGAERKAEDAIAAIPSPQLQTALTTLLRDAGGDATRFRRSVEKWYDDAMERVSGWYRRRVQLVLWVLAVLVVAVLNVDTIRMADQLWKDKTVRESVVATAQNVPASQQTPDLTRVAKDVGDLKQLKLPIGWSVESRPSGGRDWIVRIALKLVGLVLTAAALTLGAPFWFDLLGKVARVRSVGARPAKA